MIFVTPCIVYPLCTFFTHTYQPLTPEYLILCSPPHPSNCITIIFLILVSQGLTGPDDDLLLVSVYPRADVPDAVGGWGGMRLDVKW